VLFIWAAAATDSNWVSYLGPFVPFGGLATLVIIWQQRQIMAQSERIAQLSDRVVEQAEKVAPLLADATGALEAAARELNRRDR
jgi:hypothetical protein